MGSSGAGKTTLLDVLANRKTIGVIGGDRLVAGRPPGKEFQRGTAYVEQQDVHEHTTTVREALRYSAYLRQPAHVSKAEKDAYVGVCTPFFRRHLRLCRLKLTRSSRAQRRSSSFSSSRTRRTP